MCSKSLATLRLRLSPARSARPASCADGRRSQSGRRITDDLHPHRGGHLHPGAAVGAISTDELARICNYQGVSARATASPLAPTLIVVLCGLPRGPPLAEANETPVLCYVSILSRLTDLIAQANAKNPASGSELEHVIPAIAAMQASYSARRTPRSFHRVSCQAGVQAGVSAAGATNNVEYLQIEAAAIRSRKVLLPQPTKSPHGTQPAGFLLVRKPPPPTPHSHRVDPPLIESGPLGARSREVFSKRRSSRPSRCRARRRSHIGSCRRPRRACRYALGYVNGSVRFTDVAPRLSTDRRTKCTIPAQVG